MNRKTRCMKDAITKFVNKTKLKEVFFKKFNSSRKKILTTRHLVIWRKRNSYLNQCYQRLFSWFSSFRSGSKRG